VISEIQQLVDRYAAWLQDRTKLRAIDEWVEITTPFLDRHNDHLQIYAKKQAGQFVLTDDGYTMNDLAMQGCALDSPKRRALLKQTLNGFGVRHNADTGALEVTASTDSFAARKHSLIQAMLAVNDLFYLAQSSGVSLFYEDVTAWLDANDIRFTPGAKFSGKSGYDHLFDFVIPKSRKAPERYLQAVSRPDKSSAERLVFGWMDTRETRPSESKMYALLNDGEGRVSPGVVEAIKNYDITPVPWSERGDVTEALAA